jgi:hypothetical protein
VDIENQVRELVRKVSDLEQVVKGVNIITQGWNGEQLTLSDLQFTTRQPRTITLQNAWAGYNWLGVAPNLLESGAVVRRLDHRVLLSISMQGGVIAAPTLVGVLPDAKYYPRWTQWMPVMTSGGPGILAVKTDGNIECFAVPANVFVVGTFIYLADT